MRPHPYGNVWANDAVQAARLGLGDQTFQGMKTMAQRYQNYPNSFTSNTNGVFEYHGVHMAAMNESLMQSHNDKIRVFPAAPSSSSFVGKFSLLAKDGFIVSSEREGNETKYVGLKSLYGKQATVVNPWGTQQVRVRRTSDNAIITTSSAAEISFATAANTTYVVERTAKLLSAYGLHQLTGTANQAAKSLSGTASTLGINGGGTPGLINNTELTYDANWHLTTGRGYGDYNDDTHHSTTVNAAATYTFTGTGIEILSGTVLRHGQRRRLHRQRVPAEREPERERRPAGAAGGLQQDGPVQRSAHAPGGQQDDVGRHDRRGPGDHGGSTSGEHGTRCGRRANNLFVVGRQRDHPR